MARHTRGWAPSPGPADKGGHVIITGGSPMGATNLLKVLEIKGAALP